MLKKDSKINSWNMNSLQMKVISWTGRSRHLLMQKHRQRVKQSCSPVHGTVLSSLPGRVCVFLPLPQPSPHTHSLAGNLIP